MNESDKMLFKQGVQNNQYEICIVSMEEMIERLDKHVSEISNVSVKRLWEKIKGSTEFGANWYAFGDDLVTLNKLMADLGGIGRFYIKEYGGKPHIVLKGYAGLRNILTGTKYGVVNPKVIDMGLGSHGAVQAAKSGGIISILLISSYRILDYALTDESTLSHLIGTLTTDVLKIGIATAAAIAAGTVVAGLTTIAVGPIVAVIAVGVAVTWGLGKIDESLGITEKLIEALDAMGNEIGNTINEVNRQINYYENNPIDFMCAFSPAGCGAWRPY